MRLFLAISLAVVLGSVQSACSVKEQVPNTLPEEPAKVFELLRDPVYRSLFKENLDNREACGSTVACTRGRGGEYWCLGFSRRNSAVDQQKKKVWLDPVDSASGDQTQDPVPGAEQRVLGKEHRRPLEITVQDHANASRRESDQSQVLVKPSPGSHKEN